MLEPPHMLIISLFKLECFRDWIRSISREYAYVCVWLGVGQALLLVRQCPAPRCPSLAELSIIHTPGAVLTQPAIGRVTRSPTWRGRPTESLGLKSPHEGTTSCLDSAFFWTICLSHAGTLGGGSYMCVFLERFYLSFSFFF